jgi:hypothetical protein
LRFSGRFRSRLPAIETALTISSNSAEARDPHARKFSLSPRSLQWIFDEIHRWLRLLSREACNTKLIYSHLEHSIPP